MPTAKLPSGIELTYDTFGNESDEPLLLVMGLGAQMIAWRDAFCEQLQGQGFYVIRFDNRDIGLSTFLDQFPAPNPMTMFKASVLNNRELAPYYLKDMAEDAVGLLDHLGIQQAHVCGASMGGMIVQEMAIHFGERVKSLTLIMTTPGDRRLPKPTAKVLLSTMKRVLSVSSKQKVKLRAKHLKIIGSVGDLATSLDELLPYSERLEARSPERPGSTRQVLAIMCSPNRSKHLKELTVPTLIIHGEADPLVPVEHGRALEKLMPHAETEFVDDMGHDVPPALYERFAKRIAGLAFG